MADDELLALPHVPEVAENDPEDVSWALSTAGIMWARGEHAEGLRWIRKAAEAASDADADARALELAKAASELASRVGRPSAGGASEKTAHPSAKARSAPPLPASAKARSASPSGTKRTPSQASVPRAEPAPSSPPPAPAARSDASPSSKPQSVTKASSSAPKPPRAARRTAATNDSPSTTKSNPSRISLHSTKRQYNPDTDDTFVGCFDELAGKLGTDQNASAAHAPVNEEPAASDDRETPFDGVRGRKSKAAIVTARDPKVRTSQAARVIVWRDGAGVHVAPAGTVVSAITIDAVLVALEPEANLTAWLSPRVK